MSISNMDTLAGPRNWLFLPRLPEREPDPGLDPELGLEPVLPLELCSHSSCRVHEGEIKQKETYAWKTSKKLTVKSIWKCKKRVGSKLKKTPQK